MHVHGRVNGLVLQRADHLQAGAVPDVREPRVPVSAEVALVDQTVLRAVEDGAPVLQLVDPFRGVPRMELGHAPVVQELAATHRVAEVDLPAVARVDVAERCRGPAFGHDGVRLAEERLGDDAGVEAAVTALDGGAQAGAAGTHDEDVMLDRLQVDAGHLANSRCSGR